MSLQLITTLLQLLLPCKHCHRDQCYPLSVPSFLCVCRSQGQFALDNNVIIFCRQVRMVPLVITQRISFCRQKWVQHPFLTTKNASMHCCRQGRTDHQYERAFTQKQTILLFNLNRNRLDINCPLLCQTRFIQIAFS